MPNIKSAKKRMRQSVKRTARNRVRKEKLKKSVKAFRTAVTKGDAAVATTELTNAVRAVDKAGVKGILHKNTVNRRKSRMAKMVNRLAGAKA